MISKMSTFYRFLSTYSVIKRIVNWNFFFLLRDLYIECIQMKLTVSKIWLYLWRPRVVTHWLWHFWTWLICLSGHSWNYFPGSICNISEFKFSIQNSQFDSIKFCIIDSNPAQRWTDADTPTGRGMSITSGMDTLWTRISDPTLTAIQTVLGPDSGLPKQNRTYTGEPSPLVPPCFSLCIRLANTWMWLETCFRVRFFPVFKRIYLQPVWNFLWIIIYDS